jgi:hypothetical protein
MTQFASRAVGDRILDHEYFDTVSGYWMHGCAAMVMRHGGGDQCGHAYAEHPKNWVWAGQRFQGTDPEGQDFDFAPVWEPEPQSNPVNRILARLRKELDKDTAEEFVRTSWLMALEAHHLFGGYAAWAHTDHPYNVILRATAAEREHAWLVLHRLAMLTPIEELE